MTQNENTPRPDSAYECLEPALGTCLWELERDDTPGDRRARLQAHLDLCEACQWDRAVAVRLEAGLTAGTLHLPHTEATPGRRRTRWPHPAALASSGAALIAACLVLMMILPPAPTGDQVTLRTGESAQGFLRPVEGEVVHAGSMILSWTPVEGATSYRVTLRGVDVDFQWEETTHGTELKIPRLDLDPAEQQLQAVLTPVPVDLVPAGRISVTFRTGSQTQVAIDRLTKAPLWLNLLWMVGLGLLAVSVWVIDRRTRYMVKHPDPTH